MALMNLFCGANASAFEREPLTIVVRVTDYADISLGDLRAAEDEATRVYKAAHIRLVWVNPGQADDGSPALRLTVILAKHAIAGVPNTDGVLGFAFHASRVAYAFSEPIKALVLPSPVSFRVAFGRVIAHELGHLLLPTRGHSECGIMRPSLDVTNFPQRFTREQVDALQLTVLAWQNASGLRDPTVGN